MRKNRTFDKFRVGRKVRKIMVSEKKGTFGRSHFGSRDMRYCCIALGHVQAIPPEASLATQRKSSHSFPHTICSSSQPCHQAVGGAQLCTTRLVRSALIALHFSAGFDCLPHVCQFFRHPPIVVFSPLVSFSSGSLKHSGVRAHRGTSHLLGRHSLFGYAGNWC